MLLSWNQKRQKLVTHDLNFMSMCILCTCACVYTYRCIRLGGNQPMHSSSQKELLLSIRRGATLACFALARGTSLPGVLPAACLKHLHFLKGPAVLSQNTSRDTLNEALGSVAWKLASSRCPTRLGQSSCLHTSQVKNSVLFSEPRCC